MHSRACFPALLLGTLLSGGGQAAADQVFADDVIIQGSLCVGLDCVNNENFGFDTIRLKENNTRIKFDDTSTASGFPANDWQLTANDSASGGANKFSIEDVTGAKIPFTIRAGAATDSIFVASNGKVGFRTSTPVLDLHVNTSDTPGLRLEQNSSGGFSAQTWDIAGNEANFFVRDVTGGSRLPFRIRPGAPTSSVDISAAGNVGLGTSSPQSRLQVQGPADISQVRIMRDTTTGGTLTSFSASGNLISASNGFFDGSNWQRFNTAAPLWLASLASNQDRITFGRFAPGANPAAGFETFMAIDNAGNVGIGTTGPSAQLHTTGTVRFAGVANCASGIKSDASGNLSCIVSSRQFKSITGSLAPAKAVANIMALRPQTGSYKTTPGEPEHWLIAEDVAAVDPALAGYKDGKPYTVKTQNVVADLVAVIQQQQRRIEALEKAAAR